MDQNKNQFIPALSFKWLTKLFDPLIQITMPELQFKQELVKRAQIQNGERVLDVGCGTGTLLILVKEKYPNTEVIGMDIDPRILEIATDKITKSGLNITINQGSALSMPYPDNSFDKVFSTLAVHHLTSHDKVRAFNEIYRVLRPGGTFTLADFGKPANLYTQFISSFFRMFEEVADNFDGLVPGYIQEAGFFRI